MEDRYDISVDIGEDNSWSVATLCRIGEDGKYIPLISTNSLTLVDSIQRKNYGVESVEYTFSAEIVPYCQAAVDALLGWSDAYTSLLERIKIVVGKRRKTTYKTIRRDCAKRNRHK